MTGLTALKSPPAETTSGALAGEATTLGGLDSRAGEIGWMLLGVESLVDIIPGRRGRTMLF